MLFVKERTVLGSFAVTSLECCGHIQQWCAMADYIGVCFHFV